MTKFIERADGRIEFVCEHGVGHTISAPKEYIETVGKGWKIHGCDGCCKDVWEKRNV